MKSTFKIFFYLKKTTPRTNGCVPIMGRITIDGKFVQFSTKLEISPALWNQRTQRANIAKGSSAEATDINERLTYITSRMPGTTGAGSLRHRRKGKECFYGPYDP